MTRRPFVAMLVLLLVLSGCTWEEFASGGAKPKEPQRSQYAPPVNTELPMKADIPRHSLDTTGMINISGLSCIDSDGGMDLFTPGTASVRLESDRSPLTFIDICERQPDGTTRLFEHECVGNAIIGKYYPCPEGSSCEEGACVTTGTTDSCSDSDGGDNPWQRGKVSVTTGEGVAQYDDYCVPEERSPEVYEYSCDGDAVSGYRFACFWGMECRAGACVKIVREPVAQEFPVLVNGENPPPFLRKDDPFTLSWNATGLRDCAAYGAHVRLADPEAGEALLWTDQLNLPSAGAMRLSARHETLPETPILELGVSCFDAAGEAHSVSVSIPVK